MSNTELKIKGLPQGFMLRRPTMDDLQAVKQLINRGEIADYGTVETTESDMHVSWERPGFTMATDAWIVLAPDGEVVAYALVANRHAIRVYINVRVHPAYRRRGIGMYLLHLAEQRAQQYIPEAPVEARVALVSDASSVNEAGQHFLEAHGFTPVRNFWRMGIELQKAPQQAQWPEGITLRTMAPSMEHAVYEADEEAFRDHWGFTTMDFAEWSHWMLGGENFDPALCFLAMDGDEIAAFALCADEKEAGGWVHVLGVRRPWRRRGLGQALLYYAFGEFYRRNIHNVYLGVDAQSLTGATRLYERVGMHVVRQSTNYEKELRPGKELSTQYVEA